MTWLRRGSDLAACFRFRILHTGPWLQDRAFEGGYTRVPIQYLQIQIVYVLHQYIDSACRNIPAPVNCDRTPYTEHR